MIQKNRKKLRRVYTPLNVSIGLVSAVHDSPLTQVYDAYEGAFQPNRSLKASVILPVITISTADGSIETQNGNAMLSNDIKWYCNDTLITSVSAFNGMFSIRMTNDERKGELTITKNVGVNERYSLRFEGVIADARTGNNYLIKSEPVLLTTTDKSEDKWEMECGMSPTHIYNPFDDKLLEYDYKVSRGMVEPSTGVRNNCMDGRQYLQSFDLKLRRGLDLVTEGVSTEFFSIRNGVWTKMSVGTELQALSPTSFTLDMRVITDGSSYGIKMYALDKRTNTIKERAKFQFSIERQVPYCKVETINDSEIMPNDISRYDKAVVSARNKVLDTPEYLIDIEWKTASEKDGENGVTRGYGIDVTYLLGETGIGNDTSKGWLDQWVETEPRGVFRFLADDNGNQFTDENGNMLICN